MEILSYLSRQLGLASRKKMKQVNGCLTLLMDPFPSLILTEVPNEDYDYTMPRMCKWTSTKQCAELAYAIIWLRGQLDSLTKQDVVAVDEVLEILNEGIHDTDEGLKKEKEEARAKKRNDQPCRVKKIA